MPLTFDSIAWGTAITLTVTASVAFVWDKAVMTISKGLFAAVLNSVYGLLKSSFAMKIASATTKRKIPKGLPSLVDYERVSPRAFRVLGLNPGPHTLQGTNTWLICGSNNSSNHILIDTGEEGTAEEYIKLLFDRVLSEAGTKRLSKILLTHGHGDHQGGVTRILQELIARNMLPLPTIHKRNVIHGRFPPSGFVCEDIDDLEIFRIDEDTTLQACFTPGHTDDHVSFILHEDNAVLTGDCVLGCGTTVFDDLYEYMRSLQRIRKIITDSEKASLQQHHARVHKDAAILYKHKIHTIYPGHGPVIRETALEKIDEYIAHRDAREAQILRLLGCPTAPNLATLHAESSVDNSSSGDAPKNARPALRGSIAGGDRNGTGGEWHASWDLTGKMYGKLPFVVKVSAMHNVSHHLQKLRQEGRVEARWPDLWRAVQE
jgi:ribonuclease/clavin/mitogillin